LIGGDLEVQGNIYGANFEPWVIPPIIEWYDPTGGLPEDPEVGDRYGADGTGFGWTDGYIYEWDGYGWVEYEPEEGWMVWALLELLFYIFFSGGWMIDGEYTYVPYTGAIYDVDLGSHDLETTGDIASGSLSVMNCAFLGPNSAIFQPAADSTTFFQVKNADGTVVPFNIDTINNQVIVGKTSETYPFLINSTDGSDQIGMYHDNVRAVFKTTDGGFRFQTTEGTNTDTIVDIYGKGSGNGYFRCFDEDNAEWISASCTNAVARLACEGTSEGGLWLQNNAEATVSVYATAAEGETLDFRIYGYRTGDSRRALEIGVGVDAADTASFDGVSEYRFDGTVRANTAFNVNGTNVVGSQGAAVADATDAASAITQLNALLARCRAHGLIAT